MTDLETMQLALRLARRGYGATSPNPMVGAVLVKGGRVIGQGWHHRAGEPHAEIEALRNAAINGNDARGATMFVTLEPCSTHGRTPPCTQALIAAGVKKVVVAATDPNPAHAGWAFPLLKRAGIEVVHEILAEEAGVLNEAFNHWIVHRTPFITVKAAMTLDGKIATAAGESKWITGEKARAYGIKLRQGADAALVGINTVLADNPSLTARTAASAKPKNNNLKRRIILDSLARTPLDAKIVSDEFATLTTIVVSQKAPAKRITALSKHARVMVAPIKNSQIDLVWLVKKLGAEGVTSLLVEGGGEVNAAFLIGGLAHRIAFFYAPRILGGRDARKAVSGAGIEKLADMLQLNAVHWRKVGSDLLLTARVANAKPKTTRKN